MCGSRISLPHSSRKNAWVYGIWADGLTHTLCRIRGDLGFRLGSETWIQSRISQPHRHDLGTGAFCVVVGVGGLSCALEHGQQNPGLSSLNASTTHTLGHDTPKCLQTLPSVPGGAMTVLTPAVTLPLNPSAFSIHPHPPIGSAGVLMIVDETSRSGGQAGGKTQALPRSTSPANKCGGR